MTEPLHDICSAVEREFSRNRQIYGDKLQCRAGCADCCSQLFQITEIEAAEVAAGMRRLAPELRARLEEKARRYQQARERLTGPDGRVEAWGSLPPAGTRLECPALVDGRCSIYEHRPLICRKFGIPLYNPDRPGRVFACEKNFQDGDEIDDDQLVSIQTGIHERWKALQAHYNDRGGYRDPKPISVARAMIEEFPAPPGIEAGPGGI